MARQTQRIDNPEKYFHDLGDLHDARILWLNWNRKAEEWVIVVDDLQSNFADTPEYPGVEPAMIYFRGVSRLLMDFDLKQGNIGIYELTPHSHDEPRSRWIDVNIQCSPEGTVRCQCQTIEIERIEPGVLPKIRKPLLVKRRHATRKNNKAVFTG